MLLVAIVAVLSAWKIEITPLLASAGIAGIAVGFAAKDTVANFFGSIALYVDDTSKVGDYVVLDTGVAGTVLDISIRSTRLLTRDNVVVTVPNAVLNSAQIINHSAPVTKTRVKIPVGVAYGSDLETVEARLLEAAAENDDVARSPEPRVRLRGFGDFSLDYELLVWVRHPLNDGKTTHALYRAIDAKFRDADVEIPFPRRDLAMRSETTPTAGVEDGPFQSPGDGDVGHAP
ncbi:MAG: mechanosensitive ion channel family protein [Halanaeroarchaeum sp.]